MRKIKKCNKNKALFGALIGGVASIINSVISGRQQEQTAKEQLELAKSQNRLTIAQKLSESYNTTLGQGQDLYKDLYKTVVKFGGKKRIKKNIGGYVPIINKYTLNLPTLDDYIKTQFWQQPQLDLEQNYSINSNPTVPVSSTSTNISTNTPTNVSINTPTFNSTDVAGGAIGGLSTIASGALNNMYRKSVNSANLETTKNNIMTNATQFGMSSPNGINTKISNPIRVKRRYNYNNNIYV